MSKQKPKKNQRPGGSIGGPSGKHLQPQRQLRAPAEVWELIDEAVQRSGLTWSEWAREALLARVSKKSTGTK